MTGPRTCKLCKLQQHMYNKQAHLKGDIALYPTMSAQTRITCVNIRILLTKAQTLKIWNQSSKTSSTLLLMQEVVFTFWRPSHKQTQGLDSHSATYHSRWPAMTCRSSGGKRAILPNITLEVVPPATAAFSLLRRISAPASSCCLMVVQYAKQVAASNSRFRFLLTLMSAASPPWYIRSQRETWSNKWLAGCVPSAA